MISEDGLSLSGQSQPSVCISTKIREYVFLYSGGQKLCRDFLFRGIYVGNTIDMG